MSSQEKKYRKGWRNNYRLSMPMAEVIAKDLTSAAGDMMRWIKNGFRLPVVLTYPGYPSKKTTIYKIAAKLGYRITNKPVKRPDVILYFDDATFGDAKQLMAMYPDARILNVACTDISKKKVDQIHQTVFGYCTIIDPLRYTGKAVQKSDENALHDGAVIECPVREVNPSSVYQVLIDNEVDENFVMDFRVPAMKNHIPHIYKKYKKKAVRFTNDVSYSELAEVNDFFTASEQTKILSFAASMGADFCELDILRNKTDNLIYIIDVNKTPYGPPFGLSEEDRIEAVRKLAECFEGLVK
jgi:hypothetical protein